MFLCVYLLGMNCLKELDLSRCSRITDDGINHLLSIPNLEKLFISETGLTTDGAMLICSFKNLTMLDMGGLPVTDKALFSLQVHLCDSQKTSSRITEFALLAFFLKQYEIALGRKDGRLHFIFPIYGTLLNQLTTEVCIDSVGSDITVLI